MGQPYVSKKFKTGEEFEAWIEAKNKADTELQESVAKIVNGTTEVGKATNATNAENATNAKKAESATNATNAENATNAKKAESASSATNAGHADSATKATQDGNGDNIADTYAKKNGTYADMTVGNATKSKRSTEAGTADKVANSLSIETSDGNTVEYDGSGTATVGGASNPINVARKLFPKNCTLSTEESAYSFLEIGNGETGLYVAKVSYGNGDYTGLIYISHTATSVYGTPIVKTGTIVCNVLGQSAADNTKWLRLYYNGSGELYLCWNDRSLLATKNEAVISSIVKIGFVG